MEGAADPACRKAKPQVRRRAGWTRAARVACAVRAGCACAACAGRVRSATLRRMRVVSLLPSATELLFAAGGGALLVGRSHECDVPADRAGVPVLTKARTHGGSAAEIDAEVSASVSGGASLYELDERLIAELAPDVILTQSLCEVCSIDLRAVERVAAGLPKRPVVVNLDPKSVFDVLSARWSRCARATGAPSIS